MKEAEDIATLLPRGPTSALGYTAQITLRSLRMHFMWNERCWLE